MSIKKIILIDGENTQPKEYKGLEKLSKDDTVIIFHSVFSEYQSDWKLLYDIENKKDKNKPTILFNHVDRNNDSQEKNKMDFYIMAHITKLLNEENNGFKNKIRKLFSSKQAEYSIISKDRDFDKFIKFFKDTYNRELFRFTDILSLCNHYQKQEEINKKGNLNAKASTSDTTVEDEVTAKLINKLNILSRKIDKIDKKMEDISSKEIDQNIIAIPVNSISQNNILSKLNEDTNLADIVAEKSGLEESDLEISQAELSEKYSNVIFLNQPSNKTVVNSNIPSNINISESNLEFTKANKFERLDLTNFIDNFSAYPKKKKLLRDGKFVKSVFLKHNLYNKYNNKQLDLFVKNCHTGIVNIRTMNNILEHQFSKKAVNDFKPALEEIVKYQIKHNIM